MFTMTSRVRAIALYLLLAGVLAAATAGVLAAAAVAARLQAPVERPDQPPPAVEADQPDPEEIFGYTPVVRVGSDYSLGDGQRVREVTLVSGNATIAGRVYRDVTVVLGSVEIASTARIGGSLTVVGGNVVVRSGAKVERDLTVVAGSLDAPADFMPGREQNVVGSETVVHRVQAFIPWITRGLLWGRLIVPELPWMWWVVGFFFFLYFVINLVAERPVRACADVLVEKPLTTFLVGLLVLLLTGPVLLILVGSVIGIAVVPFAVCAMLLASMTGKAGVARWIGGSLVPEGVTEDGAPRRASAIRSFAIGFALLCVAFSIPILGILAWLSVGVLGLGAGVAAFISYYQRENPAKPRPVATAPLPTPNGAPAAPVFQPPPLAQSTGADSQGAVPRAAELAGYPFAEFRDRLAAFVLDVILVVIASWLLDLGTRDSGPPRIMTLLLIYHVAFWAAKSTTVGGIICQLRVVRVGGGPITFADALVRGLASILSLAVLGIGALWILKDPERQAWHDKIAGTYVVKVPKQYPL